jgi:hypothetical protein
MIDYQLFLHRDNDNEFYNFDSDMQELHQAVDIQNMSEKKEAGLAIILSFSIYNIKIS